MKCKSCDEEMSGEMVGKGFAPERKEYTCKNEKCSGFNEKILGRTSQEAKDLAQARLAKDYPKAVGVAGGNYAVWFNHDTWIIELEHKYRDDPEFYTFDFAIRDDQPEGDAKAGVRKGTIESQRWEQPFRRT
jgi:hypothetical protein